ncbi:unnamed protein product [Clonostachys rosea f. rosea IK726]|uniref:Uncharacterized protein n=1 Tax=Clonostachys rosea f. rosea IK726 TaxID=1349383 RepID=A0ACA9U5B0_BIOOC|nr:unnamed protein product [Clonostachys rosea f. rosea IK726]
MVVVAIAGGTGAVGRTIVEQLQLDGPHHKVFVMGRKTPTESIAGCPEFLQVDYEDVGSLTKILEDRKIDTVISTVNLKTEAASQSQLNLIQAADKSCTTDRFIPSEFLSFMDEKYVILHANQYFLFTHMLNTNNSDPASGLAVGGWIPNALALKKTKLQYVRISVGMFSDYWGMPHIKSNLLPFRVFLDMEKGKAVIPGTGDNKFTVTYSEDLARVIVHLLDTDKWPERLLLSGSDISMNELVACAEKIRGSKIDVVYDTVEKLGRGEASLVWHPEGIPESEFMPLLVGFSLMMISGAGILPHDNRRVDKLFPGLHLTTVEKLLATAWQGE